MKGRKKHELVEQIPEPQEDSNKAKLALIQELLNDLSKKEQEETITPPVQAPAAPIPPAPPKPPEPQPDINWAFEKGAKKTRFFNRYPLIAVLLESRAGGGTYVFFDRIGRFKKKLGLGFEYRLKYKKKKLPTSQFDNLYESNKGRVMIIDHPEEDIFLPVKVEGSDISPKETAWKEIFMNNVERAHVLLTRRGLLERYMPLVLLIVMGVMMIMALYVVRTDLAIILQSVQSAFGSATSAIAVNPPL